MSDNLADALNNIKKMVDSGNIPPEVQGMINNINNSGSDSKQTLNNMLNQVSPDMLNNLSSMLNSSNFGNKSNTNNSSNNNMNIDMDTLMRMTSIINKMNNSDSASKNLLQSLKPYLRDSRKDKLDQYSNLLNVAQIAELMKNDKKENN